MQGIKTFGKTCMVSIIVIVAYLIFTGKDPVAVGNKMVDVVVRRDPAELIVGRWIPELYQGKQTGSRSARWEFYTDGSVEGFFPSLFASRREGTWNIRGDQLSWSVGSVLPEHYDFKFVVTKDTLTLTQGQGGLSEVMTSKGYPVIYRRER
jgi:hypothetical protein